METTDGTLLGGRIRYRQPASGHRTGLEPVLLAAAIPVRSGDAVLEGGTGAGAGLLCLLARVPGLQATGVELDGGTAELARWNLEANGLTAEVLTADLLHLPQREAFDHAFANPPWHDPAGTPSPDRLRSLARQAGEAGVTAWVEALTGLVRPGGTVTLVLPGALAASGMAALHGAGCGGVALLPFWPRPGRDARLVLIQARKGSQSPGRVLPGLVLHGEDGRFTAATEAVLRGGAGLEV